MPANIRSVFAVVAIDVDSFRHSVDGADVSVAGAVLCAGNTVTWRSCSGSRRGDFCLPKARPLRNDLLVRVVGILFLLTEWEPIYRGDPSCR